MQIIEMRRHHLLPFRINKLKLESIFIKYAVARNTKLQTIVVALETKVLFHICFVVLRFFVDKQSPQIYFFNIQIVINKIKIMNKSLPVL